jgi:hypothetical protein
MRDLLAGRNIPQKGPSQALNQKRRFVLISARHRRVLRKGGSFVAPKRKGACIEGAIADRLFGE